MLLGPIFDPRHDYNRLIPALRDCRIHLFSSGPIEEVICVVDLYPTRIAGLPSKASIPPVLKGGYGHSRIRTYDYLSA